MRKRSLEFSSQKCSSVSGGWCWQSWQCDRRSQLLLEGSSIEKVVGGMDVSTCANCVVPDRGSGAQSCAGSTACTREIFRCRKNSIQTVGQKYLLFDLLLICNYRQEKQYVIVNQDGILSIQLDSWSKGCKIVKNQSVKRLFNLPMFLCSR